MAEKRNLFAAASSALGNQSKPKPAPTAVKALAAVEYVPYIEADQDMHLARFGVVTRQGAFWSYPYSHVGLIECPSQDLVVIHCTCGVIEMIEIHGRGLRKIAEGLTAGRLQTIYEAENEKFERGETVIAQIAITTIDKE